MPDKMRPMFAFLMALCLSLGLWASVQLKQEQDSLSSQVGVLRTQLSNANSFIDSLKQRVSIKEKESKELDDEINSLRKENEYLREEIHRREVVQPVSRGGHVSRVISMRATAYGDNEVDDYAGPNNLTRIGTDPVVGTTVAADPNVIPLRSRIKIECSEYPSVNGEYAVQDTGSAIKGNRIDIYMGHNKHKMMDFGVRQIKVTILK